MANAAQAGQVDVPLLLSGKVALVTGGGRGIGRAIAIGYARAGAAVCCAARTRSEIEAVAAEIEARGGQALAVTTDVADLLSVQKAVAETAARFGGLDILVINAGVSPEKSAVAESDAAIWSQTVAINLTGAYHCAKAAVPYLKARGGGKIITIGSGMGHRGAPGSSAYSVSKAGLWMLTRVLAQELRADDISVNELIPGPVLTAMTTAPSAGGSSTFDGEWFKQPQDVVPLALFLASAPDRGPTAQSFSLMRRDG